MSRLRSYLFRSLVNFTIGARFRRAGRSISDWRKLDEFIIDGQKVPVGTEISPVIVDGMAAEWVRGPDVPNDSPFNNRAILYLHGGGFVMGSPATHRELTARISAAANTRLLVLDYRLAPEHHFPAAMEDTIAAYHWLLDEGFTEDRLVMGGDSAGGGLTLQTLITLRDEGAPLPAAAFFLSPPTEWVRFDGESFLTRAVKDPFITQEMCKFTGPLYVGDNDPETPLLSPINMDLFDLPPLCIHVGDCEVLLSDSIRLAERARAANVEVELKIWPGMWHVFQTIARSLPEARQSIEEIGRFVQKHIN